MSEFRIEDQCGLSACDIRKAIGLDENEDICSILVLSDVSDAALARLLAVPHRGIIEKSRENFKIHGNYFRRHLRAGGLGLSLTTASAYTTAVADLFVRALWTHCGHSGDIPAAVPLAVHEAVSNALVHGNLEVPCLTEDPEAFERHCTLLDEALADPGRTGRRIELSGTRMGRTVEIALVDQGPGYRPAEIPAASGRRPHGLGLISACTEHLRQEDDGRCLVLTVLLDGNPPS
jgi:anti-sigma regulatory factor (Ser/Thr protein kinase)